MAMIIPYTGKKSKISSFKRQSGKSKSA